MITEFLQILTDQANAASSEGGKNTITEAHVVKALKDLEFKHLAAQVEDLAQPAAKAPPRKKNKMKDSGLSQEELLRMQQELFAESKQKMGASGSASGEDLLPHVMVMRVMHSVTQYLLRESTCSMMWGPAVES